MEHPAEQQLPTPNVGQGRSELKQAVTEPKATRTDSPADRVQGENARGKGKGKGLGRRRDGDRKPREGGSGPVGEQSGSDPKLKGASWESDEKRMSKTLTWVLRHGSQAEKLAMRPDGYVRVQDILARPRFKTFDLPLIERIVANDNKTRFNLVNEPDATSGEPVWWIRANQGHSIKAVVDLEMKPISSAADIPTGVAVHGTSLQAWQSIEKQGLHVRKRNHVHLAQGVPGTGVISGMRNASEVYIYVDVDRAIASGISFGLSANGVVLSAGNDGGYIPPEFFRKVVKRDGSLVLERPEANVQEILDKTEALTL